MFKIKNVSRLLSGLFLFIICALCEIIVSFLLTTLLNIDLLQTQKDPFLFAICLILSKFLFFDITLIIGFNRKKNGNKRVSISLKYLPLASVSFIIIILCFISSYEINDNKFKILGLISTILLILTNIYMIALIEKLNDYISTKLQ